jgi:hypothetical protein
MSNHYNLALFTTILPERRLETFVFFDEGAWRDRFGADPGAISRR